MEYTFEKSENNLIRSKFIIASLVSLKCSIDAQASDGRGMLLKNATSYVTKMQDHDIINGTIMLKFETDSPLLLSFFQFFMKFNFFFKLHK